MPAGPLQNLPLQLTSFIGREREIAEVTRLLSTARLLTLTGPGGVGKTRLALKVASTAAHDFAGVWFIDFAPLTDGLLVPQAVASALGVRDQSTDNVTEAIAANLQERPVLIVLDNCEHLVEASSSLADTLLHAAPGLTILAASRQPLGLRYEIVWRLPALSLPGPRAVPAAEDLAQYEAVQLFLERAHLKQPDFTVTADNAAHVVRLCARLDGLPLAIELAAARVGMLAVEQIGGHFDEMLRLLTGGQATAPRQQTLRATLDWSYNLLSEAERALLRELAVFEGGFTLEAIHGVCSGEIDEYGIIDLLAGLVDKSLVMTAAERGEVSYRLLETVREYAWEKLRVAGEMPALRNRHLAWYLEQAERADAQLRGPEQLACLEWLEAQYDNTSAALGWSLGQAGTAERGLQLAVALSRFWHMRGRLSEGRHWLEKALAESAEHGRTLLRARALYGAGMLAWTQYDLAAMDTLMAESLAIASELGDKTALAYATGGLEMLAHFRDDADEMRLRNAEALALFREVGDQWSLAWHLNGSAIVAMDAGDPATAGLCFDQCIALFRELGDRWASAVPLGYYGLLSYRQKNYESAQELYKQSLAIFRETGDSPRIAWVLHNLGEVALAQDKLEEAAEHFQESLAVDRVPGNKQRATVSLLSLVEVAVRQGDYRRAAKLTGAASALRGATASPTTSPAADVAAIATPGVQLGEAAWHAAWHAGRVLSLEQAIAYALETPDPALPAQTGPLMPSQPLRGRYLAGLTAREVGVLRLVAEGLPTAQIADRLVLSPLTVNAHLRSIYSKLDVTSRTAAARFALDHNLA